MHLEGSVRLNLPFIDYPILQAKLLEHNVRFGDPECQCLMMRLESDLLGLLMSAASEQLQGVQLEWSHQAALCVIMASNGYPGSYEKGTIIKGLENISNAKVIILESSLPQPSLPPPQPPPLSPFLRSYLSPCRTSPILTLPEQATHRPIPNPLENNFPIPHSPSISHSSNYPPMEAFPCPLLLNLGLLPSRAI